MTLNQTEQNLAAALRHARAGVPLFPALIFPQGDRWIKRPAVANWQSIATTDEKTIRGWFRNTPNLVAAINLGAAGLFALDPDRHGDVDGVDAFAQLACDLCPLPAHPEDTTPGGGFHHFFRQPDDGEPIGNSTGGLPEGIDVRGRGGWVPVPGTVRSDGAVYEERPGKSLAEMYAAGTVPSAPDAWIDLIRNGRADRGGSTQQDGDPVDVEAELADMRPGNVNATQCRVIGALLSNHTPYDEIVERVVGATMRMAAQRPDCRDWTVEKEVVFVRKCLTSLLKTRCREHEDTGTAPPWIDESLAGRFEEMCVNGRRPLVVWRRDRWALRDMYYSWNYGRDVELDEAAGADSDESPRLKTKTEIRWPTPYTGRPASAIPRRQWLYGKHYIRGVVTLTAAPGGTGKSQHSLVEAVSMAIGRDLITGEELAEQLRVWVWNCEDDVDEMERRICGICDHYVIDREDLRPWLFLDSGYDVPLDLAHGNGKSIVNKSVIETVAERVKERDLDVVIFDPLVALHTLQEGDNPSLAKVIRALGKIARDCGCAVELIHHTRKPGKDSDRDLTADDVRGAGAIVYGPRSGRLLHPMTGADAEKFSIEGDERNRFFRIERAKTNMARRETICWIELVERPIANGENGAYADTVAVSTLWTPPSVTDKVNASMAAAIRSEIGKRDYRRDQRAGNWAGKLIAQRLGLDVEKPSHRKQAKDVLNWLIAKGVLTTQFREDQHRKSREYIVPGTAS